MVLQACEEVCEPGERIGIVELCGLCRPPNYAERFTEQPGECAYLPPIERILPQLHSA